MIPFTPSPGSPKTVSTPQSMSRSTNNSAASLSATGPLPRNPAVCLGELLEDRAKKGGQVSRGTARDELVVDDELLVDDLSGGIPQIGPDAWPRRHPAPAHHVGL